MDSLEEMETVLERAGLHVPTDWEDTREVYHVLESAIALYESEAASRAAIRDSFGPDEQYLLPVLALSTHMGEGLPPSAQAASHSEILAVLSDRLETLTAEAARIEAELARMDTLDREATLLAALQDSPGLATRPLSQVVDFVEHVQALVDQ